MSAARRLFFALWPDAAVRDALVAWQRRNLTASVRCQHRADLHMTLHFLGQVAPEAVDELIAIGQKCTGSGFDLLLDRVGYWPQPRVLWVGPSSTPRALVDLYVGLGAAIAGIGLPVDPRRYRPHVTLARQVPAGPATGPLQPLAWAVREIALVESRPRRHPAYTSLARWVVA